MPLVPYNADSNMKILLIAPQNDLPYASAEVQDLINSDLQVEAMLGADATELNVTRRIRSATGFDVLWLATHGDENGIQLSDGVLSISALTSLVRARFALVYLNTCKSYTAAQMIQNETVATVICAVKDIPDRDAYRTGSLFAARLSEGMDYLTAYEASRPGGNTLYLFLAGKKKS